YEPFADHHGHDNHPGGMDEAPVSMVVPLLIVAAILIVVGLYTGDIVNHVIQFAIPETMV
ncbi:MAG: monovalent cation/H+ antiporter subunit D family protein, partial [Deltaproteobacteria bacterium]|nr:monovalent cation/H+ antiporter subunit D family protein [Deltaproteobacteria bacterium]